MQRFAHIAQKLYNVPLALAPGKAEVLAAALSDRMGLGGVSLDGRTVIPMAFGSDDDDTARGARYRADAGYTAVSGVAVIPVRGTLVQRLGSVRPFCGMTGYDGIRFAFMSALADPKIEGICLDIDSPGGEVSGCFDLVDLIYAARGSKPIWAILNESAYSAAYAIASAADHITVPRTGGTGSIGVIAMHTDMSKALDRAGIKVTLITYGAKKGEGSSCQPLDDAALGRMQADVDAMGELFVGTVARNRGIPSKTVRDGDAGIYLGSKGVDAGLADAVSSPDAAFRALLAHLAEKRKS